MEDPDSFCIDFNDRNSFLRGDDKLINPDKIRVYLACPLTNADAQLATECAQIRAAVKMVLLDYEYLGVRFDVYDPAEVTSPDSAHSSQEVYATDHRCTVCADLVVFVVNTPSLGVGIEAQLSASATTPRIVIAKRLVPTSRMFKGMFCSTLAEITYDSVSDVYTQLTAQLADICPKLIESIERRRPHIDNIIGKNLGRLFLLQRIRHGLRLSQVADLTDIQEWWLEQLERCPEFAATLSLVQFYRIMDVLLCRANLKDGEFQLIDTNGELQPHERISLDNLIDFVLSRSKVNESRIFSMWREHTEAQTYQSLEGIAARGLSEDSQVVSVDEWRRRYDESPLFG